MRPKFLAFMQRDTGSKVLHVYRHTDRQMSDRRTDSRSSLLDVYILDAHSALFEPFNHTLQPIQCKSQNSKLENSWQFVFLKETMNYESPPLNVSADHICDNVTFANLINCRVLQFLLWYSPAFSFVGKTKSYVSYLMHLCDKLCSDKVFVDNIYMLSQIYLA